MAGPKHAVYTYQGIPIRASGRNDSQKCGESEGLGSHYKDPREPEPTRNKREMSAMKKLWIQRFLIVFCARGAVYSESNDFLVLKRRLQILPPRLQCYACTRGSARVRGICITV